MTSLLQTTPQSVGIPSALLALLDLDDASDGLLRLLVRKRREGVESEASANMSGGAAGAGNDLGHGALQRQRAAATLMHEVTTILPLYPPCVHAHCPPLCNIPADGRARPCLPVERDGRNGAPRRPHVLGRYVRHQDQRSAR